MTKFNTKKSTHFEEKEFQFGVWVIKIRPRTEHTSGRILFERQDGSEVILFDVVEELYHGHKTNGVTEVIRYERMAG